MVFEPFLSLKGLKRGIDFRGLIGLKRGMKNHTFWYEIENRAAVSQA